jgi:hypothetical protein
LILTAPKTGSAVLLPVVFLLVFTLRSQAHADTYALYNLGPDQSVQSEVSGIDDAGDVYIIQLHCEGQSSCLGVYDPRVNPQSYPELIPPGPTYTIPRSTPLDLDNGTPCKPAPFAAYGVCNNGYEAYTQALTIGTAIFTGPDDTDQLLPGDPAADFAQDIVIDSLGDIAFTNEQLEENFEAYDLTSHQTPEPSAWILMGTGLLGFAGAVRHKLRLR